MEASPAVQALALTFADDPTRAIRKHALVEALADCVSALGKCSWRGQNKEIQPVYDAAMELLIHEGRVIKNA